MKVGSAMPQAAEDGAGTGPEIAALEVAVGVEVRGPGDEPDANLPLDAAAIADGLEAGAAGGVAHAQIAVAQSTPSTFDVVLEGIRSSRS